MLTAKEPRSTKPALHNPRATTTTLRFNIRTVGMTGVETGGEGRKSYGRFVLFKWHCMSK